MSAAVTLQSLCHAGRGILRQKTGLVDALVDKYGPAQARVLYGRPCRLVKASVGQHVRHSLDHLDRAVAAMATVIVWREGPGSGEAAIHYDLRQRGGTDESDPEAALARIAGVDEALQEIMTKGRDESHSLAVFDPVDACFMLSGDDGAEYRLPSTLARELGFAVHHAIHHLAIVRIIAATEDFGLELPVDFGKAPSTTNYERTHSHA